MKHLKEFILKKFISYQKFLAFVPKLLKKMYLVSFFNLMKYQLDFKIPRSNSCERSQTHIICMNIFQLSSRG